LHISPQGLRGCRLGTVHPEITEMQVRAIIEAAVNVAKEGVKVHPHIMIPLVGIEDELVGQAKIVNEVAAQVFAATGGRCRGWVLYTRCV
jgi:pyruvate,orthophosphate dikinase